MLHSRSRWIISKHLLDIIQNMVELVCRAFNATALDASSCIHLFKIPVKEINFMECFCVPSIFPSHIWILSHIYTADHHYCNNNSAQKCKIVAWQFVNDVDLNRIMYRLPCSLWQQRDKCNENVISNSFMYLLFLTTPGNIILAKNLPFISLASFKHLPFKYQLLSCTKGLLWINPTS